MVYPNEIQATPTFLEKALVATRSHLIPQASHDVNQ